METRGGYVPMDYEYDNGHGQRSENSPWPKADPNKSHSFFSDPQKSPFRQNSTFDASTIKLPQTPSKLPPTWREPDVGFSTDNQSSPEQADTEDTPDMPRKVSKELGKNVTLTRGRSPSKKSSRRESWMESFSGIAFNFMGSLPSPEDRPKHALLKSSRKRSRREFDRDNQLYRRKDDISDWDDSRPSSREGPPEKRDAPPAKEPGVIPAMLSFMDRHPNLPHVLAWYTNYFMTGVLFLIFFYIIRVTWRALGNEIDLEVQKKAAVILGENEECSINYFTNKCDDRPVPALRAQCATWSDCMNRDAQAIGRASISAGTFATIINSFFERLSYKAMISMCLISVICFLIPKYLIGMLLEQQTPRTQGAYQQPQFPPQYMQSPYQQYPTPQPDAYYTPHHQRFGHALEHEISPSKRGRESPTKQLGYK